MAYRKKPEIIWSPLPKQDRFLSCPAFELGYGGAKGGGKSDAILIDPLKGMMAGWQGFRCLILRRKYIDLERSLIVRSHELYRGRAHWDGQNKRWKFPNNCSIEFGHCQNENDVHNYDSAQYGYIGIEQAEQFLGSMYLHFFSCIRTTNPDIKPRFRCTFNPGGVGHSFLVDRFWIMDKSKPSNHIYEVEDEIEYPDGKKEVLKYGRAYVPATVFDNAHIMKNDKPYIARLMSLPEPYRSAYLYGRFDMFEGQFFKEWNSQVHVIEPFEIPDNWLRDISFDWGYGGGKTAMYWWAQDPRDKIWYVYRELYVNGKTDTEIGAEMASLSGKENIYCVYYPWDIDNPQPTANWITIQERMDDASGKRFYWKKANKDRKQGWMAVRFLLKIRENGEPGMKIFNTCKNLVRTLPQQVFDEGNNEDLDTNGEDHAVDGIRYKAASYIPLHELEAEANREDQPVDLGGAMMIPAHKDKKTGASVPKQFVMKREPAMAMNWLGDY